MQPRYRFHKKALLGGLLLLLLAPTALAQSDMQDAAEAPRADPADVASVDALIAALYDVISGPAGETRDWDRFRALAVPTAQLIPIYKSQQAGEIDAAVMTVEDYVERAGPYLEQNGFFEVETARTTERYGNLVHAFSTYESFRTAEDTEPFMRGINSIQLIHKNDRWWILNIAWQPEWDDLPIPDKYLPN